MKILNLALPYLAHGAIKDKKNRKSNHKFESCAFFDRFLTKKKRVEFYKKTG